MRVIDVDTCSCQLYIFLGTSSSLFLSDHSKNLRVENISSGDIFLVLSHRNDLIGDHLLFECSGNQVFVEI